MPLPIKKRYLSPEVLEATAATVAKAARDAGVNVALMGGYAMHHYGSDRLTGDIDFIADGRVPGMRSVRGISIEGEPAGVTGKVDGVEVDLVMRTGDYEALFEEALSQAVTIRGTNVRVVTPEHLVAIKMEAKRPKDQTDLDYLLASGVVDQDKARAIVKRHLGPYAAQELDSLAESAQFMQARANPTRRRRRRA